MMRKCLTSSLFTLIFLFGLADTARAASFNFSYVLFDGRQFSGNLEGDIVPTDTNRIVVTEVSNLIFDGRSAPALPFLGARSSDPVLPLTGVPIASLDGSYVDIAACAINESNRCGDGISIWSDRGIVSTGTQYGGAFEEYKADRWVLNQIPEVYEPLSALCLFMMGTAVGWRTRLNDKG
jgi:hypothetical protein